MSLKMTKWESTLAKWTNREKFYSYLDDTIFFTSLLSYITTRFLLCLSFEATCHRLLHTDPPHHPRHLVPQHDSITDLYSHFPHTTRSKYWEPCYSASRPLVEGSKAGPSNPSATTLHPNSLFLTSSPIRSMVNGRPRVLFALA